MRRYIGVYLVGLLGVLIAALTFAVVRQEGVEQVRKNLAATAVAEVRQRQGAVTRAVEALHSVQAFYGATGIVDRGTFSRFAALMLAKHPGIDSLRWMPRVAADDRPALETAARAEGFLDFAITEIGEDGGLVAAEPRPDHFPAYFVEPMRGNQAVFGFDGASEPILREALQRARDTAELTLSGRVVLRPGAPETGVLAVLPVFEVGLVPQTVEDRGKRLTGFVAAAIDFQRLFEARAQGVRVPGVSQVVVSDLSPPAGPQALFGADLGGAGGTDPEALICIDRTTALGGRRWLWTVCSGPEAAVGAGGGVGATTAGLGALLVALLLAATLYARRRAKEEGLERYRIENELQATEGQLERALDTASDWVWETDAELRLTHVSSGFYERTGLEPENVTGRRFKELAEMLGSEEDGALDQVLLDMERRHPFRWAELAIGPPGGGQRYVGLNGVPLVDEAGGQFLGYWGTGSETTKLHTAEDDLRHGERRVRSILDASPLPIVISRISDGTVVYVNRRAVERMGREESDILDAPVASFYANPSDRRALLDRLAQENGAVEDFEAEMVGPTGRKIWTLISAVISDFEGESAVIASFQDFDARKRAELELEHRMAFQQILMETIPNPIFYKDRDGRYMGCNRAFAELVGMDASEVVGKTMVDLGLSDRASVSHERDLRLIVRPEELRYDVPITDAKGRHRVIRMAKAVFSDADGNAAGIVGVMSDITDQKRAEDEARKSEERLRAVLSSAPVPIVVSRPSGGQLVFSNEGAAELFEIDLDRLDEYGSAVFYDDPSDRGRFLHQLMKTGEVRQFEACFKTMTGRRFWGLMSAILMRFGNEPAILTTFTDITERKRMEEELRELATTDPLTGVPNRREFLNLATREMVRAKRYGGNLALLIIDADHFKSVNDSYGHDVGDEMLCRLAEAFRKHRRASDVFGRIGGEEFGFVLPETDLEGAVILAERLRSSIESQQFETRAGDIPITVSIGVGALIESDKGLTDVLRRADEALYEAKAAGRNRVCSESMTITA